MTQKPFQKKLPVVLPLHVKRIQALEEASGSSRCFIAPKVIGVRPEKATIDLEYLPQSTPLHRLLVQYFIPWGRENCQEKLCLLFRQTGRALADIHKFFSLPSGPCISISPDYLPRMPMTKRREVEVTLKASHVSSFHGDFGISNVRFFPNDPRPIILDPIPSRFCPDSKATQASIYYDLGQMVSTIWSVLPFRLYALQNPAPLQKWTHFFLSGYEEESNINLCRNTVWACAWWQLKAYMDILIRDNWKKRTIRIMFRPSLIALSRELCLD